jgi:hypothetical protein
VENPFKGRHFQADIILICTRWYLRYALSYRDIEEMMTERGLSVDRALLQKILSSSNLRRFIPESSPIKAAYMDNPFKWRHFQPEIILLVVRWNVSNIMHILIN